MAADELFNQVNPRRRVMQNRRREEKLKHMRVLTAWALAISSVSGLLSMYHLLTATRTYVAQFQSNRAGADTPRAGYNLNGEPVTAEGEQHERNTQSLYQPALDQPAAAPSSPHRPSDPHEEARELSHERPIFPGSRGPEVTRLQQMLSRLGLFTLGYFTDDYGPVTEGAVSRFQRAHHLPVTGVADSATLHAIETAIAAESKRLSVRSTSLQRGPSGANLLAGGLPPTSHTQAVPAVPAPVSPPVDVRTGAS